MINATVTGNLGRDPELKDTKTGKKMASFSVASTTKRDGRDPETTWIDVVCFDEVAEGGSRQFQEGDEGLDVRPVVAGDIRAQGRDRGDCPTDGGQRHWIVGAYSQGTGR